MNEIEKIRKVLKIKGISLYEANRQLGLGAGTLHKMEERNGGWHNSTKEKFIRHFDVSEQWWNTGFGEIFNEKGTFVVNEPGSAYRKSDQNNMDYRERIIELQDRLLRCQAEKEKLREELLKYLNKAE